MPEWKTQTNTGRDEKRKVMKLFQNDMKLENILKELEFIEQNLHPEHINLDTVKKYCSALCTLDKLVAYVKSNSFKNWNTEDACELRSKLSHIKQLMENSFGRMVKLLGDKKAIRERGGIIPSFDLPESYKRVLEDRIDTAKTVTALGIGDILNDINEDLSTEKTEDGSLVSE